MRTQILCASIAATAAMRPFAALPSHSRRRTVARRAAKGNAVEKRDVPSQVWPIAAAAVMGISSSAALARGVAGEAAPAAIACWRVAGASALNLATRRARRGVAASTGATRHWRLAPVCSSRRISCFFSRRCGGRPCCDPQSWSASARSGSASRIGYAVATSPTPSGSAAPAPSPERRSWPATRPEPRRPAIFSPRRRACCGPRTFWRAATRGRRRPRVGRPAGVPRRDVRPRARSLLRGDALWGFSRQTALLLAGFVACRRWSATRVSPTWSL